VFHVERETTLKLLFCEESKNLGTQRIYCKHLAVVFTEQNNSMKRLKEKY